MTATDDLGMSIRPAQLLVVLGVICLLLGSYYGLFVAPPETYMGQVQRIMYVHVPTAWNALLALTFAFICAVIFLFKSDWKWDARMEASIEVGVVLGFLCVKSALLDRAIGSANLEPTSPRAIEARWGSFTEWYVFVPNGFTIDRTQHYADGGFTYHVTNNLQLDIRAGVGLNEAADDFFAGSGVVIRF